MSYDKVSQFSMNLKNLTFSGRFASNNVFPLDYESYTSREYVCPDNIRHILTDQEYFILAMVKAVAGGSFQLQKGVSSKYRFAFLYTDIQSKAFMTEHPSTNLEKDNLDFGLYTVISNVFNGDASERDIRVAKYAAELFNNLLESPDMKIDAFIQFDAGFLTQILKSKIRYSSVSSSALQYDSLKSIVLDLYDLSHRFDYTFKPILKDNTLLSVDRIFMDLDTSTSNKYSSEAFIDRTINELIESLRVHELNQYYDDDFIHNSIEDFKLKIDGRPRFDRIGVNLINQFNLYLFGAMVANHFQLDNVQLVGEMKFIPAIKNLYDSINGVRSTLAIER